MKWWVCLLACSCPSVMAHGRHQSASTVSNLVPRVLSHGQLNFVNPSHANFAGFFLAWSRPQSFTLSGYIFHKRHRIEQKACHIRASKQVFPVILPDHLFTTWKFYYNLWKSVSLNCERKGRSKSPQWLIASIEPVLLESECRVFPINTPMGRQQEFGNTILADTRREPSHTGSSSVIFWTKTGSDTSWMSLVARGEKIVGV